MRILMLGIAAVLPGASAAAPAPTTAHLGTPPASQASNTLTQEARVISPVPSTCKPVGSVAQGENRRPLLKRLDELPPAETYMAIYRTDEQGCLDPMLARELQRPRGLR